MEWHDNSRRVKDGDHAFLGASKYSWLNYDEDKLIQTYKNFQAVLLGTRLHAYAAESIRLGQKLPKSRKTLNMYVNDAIGFRMTPELPLYYSENCFGTTDAIAFKNDFLRIHDLKTGTNPASLHQLEIYAALFCLEYSVRPKDIEVELRIYQNDDIIIGQPSADVIEVVMNKIVAFDKVLERVKEGD